jgi:hypothetical protein
METTRPWSARVAKALVAISCRIGHRSVGNSTMVALLVMTDSERYHFNDLTGDNYSRLLRLAKTHYPFSRYTDFDPDQRVVMWRHDRCQHDREAAEQALQGLRNQ